MGRPSVDESQPAGDAPWREQDTEGWCELQTDGDGHVCDAVLAEVRNMAGGTPFSACREMRHGDFLDVATLAGKHVFLCPPVHVIGQYLSHYRNLKARSPHDTSACIMVPRWMGMKWRSLLTLLKGAQTFFRDIKRKWDLVGNGKFGTIHRLHSCAVHRWLGST